MKKYLSVLTVSCILAFALLLSGCSSPSKPSVSIGDSLSESVFDTSGTIEKTTLIDDDMITVIANDLTYSNNRALLNISVTNKTASEVTAMAGTFGFSANYINDHMVPGYIHEEIAPGATETDDVIFQLDELKLYGINGIAEIGLGLAVEDDDYNYLLKEIFPIKTSLFDSGDVSMGSFQKAINDPAFRSLAEFELLSALDEESFNQNGITIESVALVKNKDGDTTLFVEIKNDTNDLIVVNAGDVMVNGAMVYEGAWTSDNIASGKTCIMDIKLNNSFLSDEELEEINFNSIQNASFEFSANDSNRNTLVAPVVIAYEF